MAHLFQTVILLTLLASPLLAGDWPNFMGPDRNHISQETEWAAPKDKPNVLWKAKVGVGFSGISVADGKAYTIGSNGKAKVGGQETVSCFDAITGKVIWKKTYDAKLIPNIHKGGPNVAPTILGKAVITISKEGRLQAFDAATGSDLWKATEALPKTRWGNSSAPLFDGESLWTHTFGPNAYNPATGAVKLSQKVSAHPGNGSLAFFEMGDRKLMAALTGDTLQIYERPSGKAIASYPFPIQFNMHATTPIVTDGPDGVKDIFLSCANDGGHCEKLRFDGSKVTKLWSNKSMRNFMNNCVLIDGHLFGFDGKHAGRRTALVCLSYEDGSEKWRKILGVGAGSVIAANKQLIVLSEEGSILVAPATPDGFKPTVEHKILERTCWTPLTLSNGLIYARNDAGDLVCLDWRKK